MSCNTGQLYIPEPKRVFFDRRNINILSQHLSIWQQFTHWNSKEIEIIVVSNHVIAFEGYAIFRDVLHGYYSFQLKCSGELCWQQYKILMEEDLYFFSFCCETRNSAINSESAQFIIVDVEVTDQNQNENIFVAPTTWPSYQAQGILFKVEDKRSRPTTQLDWLSVLFSKMYTFSS